MQKEKEREVEISEERYEELLATEKKYEMLFEEWHWLGSWLSLCEREMCEMLEGHPNELWAIEQTFKILNMRLQMKCDRLHEMANEIDKKIVDYKP